MWSVLLLTASLAATPSAEWREYDAPGAIAEGSALDFSFLVEAPAGRHGPLVVRDDRFVFAHQPEKRVRFFGTNLCYGACFPTPEAAEALAQRLARSGYNSVRFHHFDWQLTGKEEGRRSFDPVALDRLDALFAACKRHGLYLTIDLFTYRAIPQERVPGLGKLNHTGFKGALHVDDAAKREWEWFALELLNHVNPYTGLAWKDDPALISICPVNEDAIHAVWKATPEIRAAFEQQFATWLEKAGRSSEKDSAAAFNEFLTERNRAITVERFEFLRQAGVRQALTGVNHRSTMGQTFTRAACDYVDHHRYWDAPRFPQVEWRLPYRFHQRSALAEGSPVTRQLMSSRQFGKPYFLTEYDISFPTRRRAEAGLLFGLAAGQQDWDGLYRFAFAHSEEALSAYRIKTHDTASDPISLLTDRLVSLFFLRGDVAAFSEKTAVRVRGAEAFQGEWGRPGDFPESFNALGFSRQIGSFPEGDAPPAGVEVISSADLAALPPPPADLPSRLSRVATPASAAIYLEDSQPAEVGPLAAQAVSGAPCLVAAASLDSDRFETSSRLLLLNLTDVRNTGLVFAEPEENTVTNWGTLPLRLRTSEVRVSLRLDTSKRWRAWALSLDGKRLRDLPLEPDGEGRLRLRLNSAETPALAYELAAEPAS